MLESGGRHTIVPIAISYERTPEQKNFASEGGMTAKSGLGVDGLFDWALNVVRGRVKLGRVKISANGVIPFSAQSNIKHTVRLLQDLQCQNVMMSDYHIEAGAKCLSVDRETLRQALVDCGAKFWEGPASDALPPTTMAENWSVCLQFGHCFASALEERHPSKWSSWLFASASPNGRECTPAVSAVTDAFHAAFKEAERGATAALEWLQEQGFDGSQLLAEHVFSYYDDEKFPPAPLCGEAVRIVLERAKLETVKGEGAAEGGADDEVEEAGVAGDEEAFGAWGYRDSKFVFTEKKTVMMRSKRYGVGGKPLPKLIKYFEEEMGVTINVAREKLPAPRVNSKIVVQGSTLSLEQRQSLERVCECSYDDRIRVRHGYGHSQSDIYALRQKKIAGRVPDAVCYVKNEEDCKSLIKVAEKEGLVLVPFGGGTNVAQMLLCPSKEKERRCIVSVDTRKLNRVLWVDEANGLAKIEAGMTGKEIGEELGKRGFTLGHEPDR